MATDVLDEIDKLTHEMHEVLERESSDDAYVKFQEYSIKVNELTETFKKSLLATKKVRDAQKAYFKARKAKQDYDATSLMRESQDLEKGLDKAVNNWLEKLAPADPQQKLFD